MKLAKHQAGMTAIGWMIMIVLVGFLAIFFIKLVPVYIESFTVRSVITGLGKEAGGDFSTVQNVREAIDRRFSINSVTSVEANEVIIEPSEAGFSLSLDYEVRVPFVYNIELVAKFSEQGQVGKH
jgi:hypothetical protein